MEPLHHPHHGRRRRAALVERLRLLQGLARDHPPRDLRGGRVRGPHHRGHRGLQRLLPGPAGGGSELRRLRGGQGQLPRGLQARRHRDRVRALRDHHAGAVDQVRPGPLRRIRVRHRRRRRRVPVLRVADLVPRERPVGSEQREPRHRREREVHRRALPQPAHLQPPLPLREPRGQPDRRQDAAVPVRARRRHGEDPRRSRRHHEQGGVPDSGVLREAGVRRPLHQRQDRARQEADRGGDEEVPRPRQGRGHHQLAGETQRDHGGRLRLPRPRVEPRVPQHAGSEQQAAPRFRRLQTVPGQERHNDVP
mmetsp:Transcript_12074/g.28614  ORF Transcript_12074/g.28614 Transcript_12074/m.28614 type:complete len:308 (+) Transcript_12074:1895-2818(+)